MEFRLFTVSEIIELHDAVLNPSELDGLAKDVSLEGALARVDFRMHYNMITDVYELAAMYAVAISQAHAFRDANKRTAHAAMKLVLKIHGIHLVLPAEEIGDIIIKTAQGHLDEVELSAWLRTQTQK
jgi:death-on-curing protein